MKSKILSSLFLLTLMFSSQQTVAAEGDVYGFSWLDQDKEVFVLQNRKYRKSGRIHAFAGAGITTSGAYVDSTSFQGRLGFFMSEDYGFEVLYAKNSGKENDTYKAVTTANSTVTPFRRIVSDYIGAMFLWAPFYSKINTFNTVVYADYIFGLGVAKLSETNNKKSYQSNGIDKTETDETHTGLMWQVGMKFHLGENWSVRPDLTVIHYQAEGASSAKKKITSNYDATISLGYTF